MKQFKIISLCLIFAIYSRPSSGQGTGFELLTIGPNTKALGLNEATTAALLGASDVYSNPANLVFESSSSLNTDYSLWIAGLTNTHIAANFKKESSAIGLGLLASEAKDFELRDRPGPSQGSFTVSYLSFTGAYAYKLYNFSAGVSLQYLREELYIYNASGYAINAGISSHWLDEKLFISATLQNLGKMNDLNSEETLLPTRFRTGFSASVFKFSPKDDLSLPIEIALLSDLVLPLQNQNGSDSNFSEEEAYMNIGVSIKAAEIITIRGGYKTGDSVRPLSFGTGLSLNNISAEYALIPFETGFGTVHSIGIGYNF